MTARPVVKMSHRPYLRVLSRRNRRAWAEQRARLTPRVAISSAFFISHLFPDQYAYIDIRRACFDVPSA
jgi:hypothetical protein